MQGLVLVHPETVYMECGCGIDPQILTDPDRNFPNVVERIAERVSLCRQNKEKVTYLGYTSKSPSSSLIHPQIRRIMPQAAYFPAVGTMEGQFLSAKLRLMEDKADITGVCGLLYDDSIRKFFNLLTKQESWKEERDRYEVVAASMGWPEEKFNRVYDSKVFAHVITPLTDLEETLQRRFA